MKSFSRSALPAVIAAAALAMIVAVTAAYAKRPQQPAYPYPPAGIYLQLSEDFYRDMGTHDDDTRTLSTNLSETYLRQIAVATRYTVETNLKILQQQARIIELLETQQKKSTP
jgi:hypothetical protein